METGFVLGLGAITLAVIACVIVAGRALSRAVEANASESLWAMSITMSGTVLYACLVAFWIACAIFRAYSPESRFGTFLGSADGVATVVVVSVLIAVVAGAVLDRCGLPAIVRK